MYQRLLKSVMRHSLRSVIRNCRYFSSNDALINRSHFHCEKLSRSVIRVVGDDTYSFLQSLITNDMKHLEDNGSGVGADCIYSLMLNVQGRVLYDTIIYKMGNTNGVLLEYDKEAKCEVENHLKMYKLRKKVDIASMDDESTTWAIFPNPEQVEFGEGNQEVSTASTTEFLQASTQYLKLFSDLKDNVLYAALDPRLSNLGFRVAFRQGVEPDELIQVKRSNGLFCSLRYKLGIGEGLEELPPGQCFPLECNADYLHGVSFHKGCYLGQELTARTHHTGVVRKRLMPLRFLEESSREIANLRNASVVSELGKSVGKVRACRGDSQFGLGLLRIQESMLAKQLVIADVPIRLEARRPFWWPREVSKESLLKS